LRLFKSLFRVARPPLVILVPLWISQQTYLIKITNNVRSNLSDFRQFIFFRASRRLFRPWSVISGHHWKLKVRERREQSLCKLSPRLLRPSSLMFEFLFMLVRRGSLRFFYLTRDTKCSLHVLSSLIALCELGILGLDLNHRSGIKLLCSLHLFFEQAAISSSYYKAQSHAFDFHYVFSELDWR